MYPYGGSPSWSSSVGFQAPGMMQPQEQPQGALGAALNPMPGGYGVGGGINQDMMKQMMIKALQQKQAQQPGALNPSNTLIPSAPMPG